MPRVEMPVDVAPHRRMLPHRYPFLLVDRVIEFEHGQAHTGDQERDLQRALLPGPLPGPSGDAGRADPGGAGAGRRPADAAVGAHGPTRNDTLFYLVKIDKARFTAWCVPGDQLHLEVELKRMVIRNMAQFVVHRQSRRRGGRQRRNPVRRARCVMAIHPTRNHRSRRATGRRRRASAPYVRHRRRRRDRRRHAASARTA